MICRSESDSPTSRVFAARTVFACVRAGLLLCVLLCGGCGGRPSDQVSDQFREAQRLFDEAESSRDYLRAAGLYQEILDAGMISGVVLYNQGNAFALADRRGQAIACYRRAMRYRPRDAELQANLRFVAGNDSEPETRPWVERILFWQNWLSYREKFLVTGALAIVAFLLGVASLLRPEFRAFTSRAAAACAAVTLLAGFSAAYDWYRYDVLEYGVTISDRVIARLGDGEKYEPAFTEPLEEGTEFLLRKRRSNWLLIELPGQRQGWIPVENATVY